MCGTTGTWLWETRRAAANRRSNGEGAAVEREDNWTRTPWCANDYSTSEVKTQLENSKVILTLEELSMLWSTWADLLRPPLIHMYPDTDGALRSRANRVWQLILRSFIHWNCHSLMWARDTAAIFAFIQFPMPKDTENRHVVMRCSQIIAGESDSLTLTHTI